MAIKGKVIGAILGAFTFGPIGAVVGLTAGHFIDSKTEAIKQNIDDYIKLVCAGVFSMARLDGKISDAEIAEIESIFDRSQMDSLAYEKVAGYMRSMHSISVKPSEVTEKFAEKFIDPSMRVAFFGAISRVAFADGNLASGARDELEKSARILGINWSGSARQSHGEFQTNSSELMEAYAILGVSADASDDEIKKVYRAKCRELHPDILRSKGVGEIAIKAIQDELCRVNDAYSLIEKYRNG